MHEQHLYFSLNINFMANDDIQILWINMKHEISDAQAISSEIVVVSQRISLSNG